MGQERITTKIASFAIYLYSAFHYSKIPSFQPLLLPAAGGLLPAVFLHALCALRTEFLDAASANLGVIRLGTNGFIMDPTAGTFHS
jgi:hypothetical protein